MDVKLALKGRIYGSSYPSSTHLNLSNLSWSNSKRAKFCLDLSFVMNIVLGLTVRSFLKAWGKAEPSLACSASLPEHQADAVEGILFQVFKPVWLCLGFAWSVQVHWAWRPLWGTKTSTVGLHFSQQEKALGRLDQGQTQLCLCILSMGNWCTEDQSIRTEQTWLCREKI